MILQPIDIVSVTQLPVCAGVSSSAAVSLAAIAAAAGLCGHTLSKFELCNLAFQIESAKLRTGAGQMDFYACGLGGVHYMSCGSVPPFPLVRLPVPDAAVVLVDTLSPHETKRYVSSKRKRLEQGDPGVREYVRSVPRLVESLRSLMADSPTDAPAIGELITECHRHLRDHLACSTPLLDAAVEACLRGGAYGAKLTGSGMGGCMFALAARERLDGIAYELQALPVKVHMTSITAAGAQFAADVPELLPNHVQ